MSSPPGEGIGLSGEHLQRVMDSTLEVIDHQHRRELLKEMQEMPNKPLEDNKDIAQNDDEDNNDDDGGDGPSTLKRNKDKDDE